jgi:hypothetical protein
MEATRGKTILIVEDERDVVDLLTHQSTQGRLCRLDCSGGL